MLNIKCAPATWEQLREVDSPELHDQRAGGLCYFDRRSNIATSSGLLIDLVLAPAAYSHLEFSHTPTNATTAPVIMIS